MKTCECGGTLYRHGAAVTAKMITTGDGVRYRCKSCRKTITVRDGNITGRFKKDWRHELDEGGSVSPDLGGVPTGEGGERGSVQIHSASRVEQGRSV